MTKSIIPGDGSAGRSDDLVRQMIGWGAIVAPLAHSLTDVGEWLRGGYSESLLWLNYLAFLPIPVVVVGLATLQRPRIHLVGLGGAVLYGFAFVYFAHTTLFALAVESPGYQQLWDRLGWLYTFHGGLMIVGGLAYGLATARAGVLPQWTAWMFLAGVGLNLLVAVLTDSAMLQTVATMFRNAGLVGMGWAFLRTRG